nr:MerR family DNA-binding transcriptional regulator [Clostridioides difficile]
MSQVSKNYFTTGEFAKICGINKKTLFHYDDIGLFSPELKKVMDIDTTHTINLAFLV